MYRIWAVARHMIAESIRQKIALVGIFVIGGMLVILPFVTEGDGATLTSRVQSFLAYMLGSIGFILSLVTIFLSCLAINDEIVNKRIFMIASKPIPRWQFFFGKWLGIGTLNAALMLACLLSILFATWSLKRMKTTVPGDRERLQYEVLNARHGVPLKEPNFTSDIEERIRLMREQGRFEEVNPATEQEIRVQILEDLRKSWRSIAPSGVRRFEFNVPMVDRSATPFVFIRIKPVHASGLQNVDFPATIQCGDPSQTDTLTGQLTQSYAVGSFHSIPIPSYAINSNDILYVIIRNDDPRGTYTFEGNDSFELMYDLGTFHWNLFRAFSMMWCQLAFLAAVGLLMSSCLSYPVACMATFLVYIVSSNESFLLSAMNWVTPLDSVTGRNPLGAFGSLFSPLIQGFMWLVPDFSLFDPVGNVVNGRLVPLMWVIQTLVVLILIKGLAVAVLGSIILSKRELAKET